MIISIPQLREVLSSWIGDGVFVRGDDPHNAYHANKIFNVIAVAVIVGSSLVAIFTPDLARYYRKLCHYW